MADSFNVLVIDHVDASGMDLLRARSDIDLTWLPDPDDASVVAAMRRADGLLLRGRYLSDAAWNAAARLRIVSRHGVGCDNLDLRRLAERNVTVAITADANAISVAEHALALMLAAARRLVEDDRNVRTGNWAARERLAARDLYESTLFVVGFGRVGRAVAERAAAFGMRVVVHDPMLRAAALPAGVRLASDLDRALAEADVLSLNVPLTPATRGMISAPQLARMPRGAIVVNTSRGGVVDEQAMLAALDAGRIGQYATDVLQPEPPPAEHPMIARRDVLLTPHVAAMTQQGSRRMAERAARNLLDFFDGRLDAEMIVASPPLPEPARTAR